MSVNSIFLNVANDFSCIRFVIILYCAIYSHCISCSHADFVVVILVAVNVIVVGVVVVGP